MISKKHKVMKRFEVWPELAGGQGLSVRMILKSHPSFELPMRPTEVSVIGQLFPLQSPVPSHKLSLTAFYN